MTLQAAETPEILTPAAPASPRINGPTVFGVTPGAPFLYTIPVTGDRPMSYSVDALPPGLSVDASSGRITGSLKTAGEYAVVLRAKNSLGSAEKHFRIVCGDTIALTPPMGWNSWNCWAGSVDHDKVLRSAKAMVSSGLADHGWTYVNIDDTWQGKRRGPSNALQGNERFPDMKKLCDEVHNLGLKAGIYSSPWITTYAGFPGDNSDNEKGDWQRIGAYPAYTVNQHFGKFSFAVNDAKQFAAWGIDYLKYDWNPNDVAHTRIMSDALRSSGRDIVFSLSNSAPYNDIGELSKLANCWRTTGDIWDTWDTSGEYQHSISEIGFNQDAWTKISSPGHWNDTDMLVVGYVGWGPALHETRLSPAEQYTHITLWCMLSAPLLIGCDMERLDAFTLNLLTNDEVLAINQDALGKQASRVYTIGAIDVYKKELEDGSLAYAFFNRGDAPHTVAAKLDRLGMSGKQQARDLWRQKDLGVFEGAMPVTVQPHNVLLVKMTAVK
jgi:alpha-galactosidase